jgi:dihydrofolate reductase
MTSNKASQPTSAKNAGAAELACVGQTRKIVTEVSMRRVRYAVVMSLDGYIAGPKGEADWIVGDPAVNIAEFFKAFYAQFDIAVMGRRTYELVGGPIDGMRTYVFSRTLSPADCKGVTILSENGIGELARLRAEDGRDIWLFGGGVLFGSLASAGLVDSVELGVMPVLLGGGTPVVGGITQRIKLKLIQSEHSAVGIVSLKYELDNSAI